MTEAIVLHEAAVELGESVAYYEERAAGLGLDFEAEMLRAVEAICAAPNRWPLRKDGTRRYLAHRFPFLVIYACHNDQVWIIAFAHCKRRSGYWRGRV